MRALAFSVCAALIAALATPALITSTATAKTEDGFTLAHAVPDDVFLYIAQRHNPEREFLDHYWQEVFESLEQSGVGDDLIGLFGSILGFGPEQTAEVERIQERASQLLAGVDWNQLAGKETVFAEQFEIPSRLFEQRPPIMMPNMVWLFRGSDTGASQNYEGLVAILDSLVDEINKAVGSEALVVDRTKRMDAQVASVNMLATAPGEFKLPLSVALSDDVVVIGMREHLFSDVLDLLSDRSGQKQALADNARFKAAFAQLPPAEDSMVFFNMQALLKPIQGLIDSLIDLIGEPSDIYRRTGTTDEGNKFNARAMAVYRSGDFEQALALTKQAHEAAPEDSIILYNLACFNAQLGNQDEALAWLEKAVEGGFYAPGKIANDRDLQSLRGEPKYKTVLAQAAELAAEHSAKDIVINGAKSGEEFRLLMQAYQAYQEKNYEQGLKLSEQAYAVAPAHSRVLYSLACFHALLGHENKALDFLEKAVDSGFYCPRHISKDPDWENLRKHEHYETILVKARSKAREQSAHKAGDNTALARILIARLMNAVGVLDYSAAVETTDGYAAWTESIAVLVPDAQERPIYPVFGKRPQLTNFERYLPEETKSFSISSGLNFAELYKFIEDSFRIIGPRGEELLAKWTELQKQIGVDVRKDIIDWIDGGFISVTLADNGGSVILIKVTDEQVARENVTTAIEFLSSKLAETLSEVATKNPALVALSVIALRTSPVEHEQLEGFQNLYLAVSPEPVAVWGVANGHLIFSSSANAAALCLATARGDHPNIQNNARAMSEVLTPDGSFVSASLTDRRGLGDELAAGCGIASMVSGMMGTFIPEPRVRPVLARISGIFNKLAPVVSKINFYKSAAARTTFDGQIWRSRGVTHYFSPAERAASNAD